MNILARLVMDRFIIYNLIYDIMTKSAKLDISFDEFNKKIEDMENKLYDDNAKFNYERKEI